MVSTHRHKSTMQVISTWTLRRYRLNKQWPISESSSSSLLWSLKPSTWCRRIRDFSSSSNTSPSHKNDNNKYLDKTMRTSRSRIVIVGGGPTGLFMGHMLQSYNVPFLLVEAQTPDERFLHPQAHFLNTRTMEIIKHGLGNDLYGQIRSAMAPVEEWKSFYFGPTMTSDGAVPSSSPAMTSSRITTMMAQVVHPVDRPLIANADANGVLQQPKPSSAIHVDRENSIVPPIMMTPEGRDKTSKSNSNSLPLSEVSVGHLAQHTFCKILHESLVQRINNRGLSTHDNVDNDYNKSMHSTILYGTRVTGCNWDDTTSTWTLQTTTTEGEDSTLQAAIIVAADGAKSWLRTNILQIPMNGQSTIQHLMNVHFQVSEKTERTIPPGMLYTIFHPDVLAMVVRHGPGDYVMQIPYFPPYQTPEQDFTEENVSKMVEAALGGNTNRDHHYSNDVDFTIRSIRPWTMGSLVAQEYYNDKGILLVGDAAHIFPPAGGFGMNTGLQDVYSLAWRLALLRLKDREHEQRRLVPSGQGQEEESESHSGRTVDHSSVVTRTGRLYQQERQPVARRNAALSVRNYRRVLGVMESCYLNHKHPTTLIAALDATSPVVPFHIRQHTFQTLLRTALSPFSQLLTSPGGVYARHVTNNLRKLLQSGQGLPLLFPKHELDFSYPRRSSPLSNGKTYDDTTEDWTKDSWSSSPRLAVGGLFPHFIAYISSETIRRFPFLLPIMSCLDAEDVGTITQNPTQQGISRISTRDLASQLATPKVPLVFCLLAIQSSVRLSTSSSNAMQFKEIDLVSLAKKFQDSVHVPCVPVQMLVMEDPTEMTKETSYLSKQDNIVRMAVDVAQWKSLKLIDDNSSGMCEEGGFCLVLIRPDGHVASIISDDPHLDTLIDDTIAIL